MPSAPQAYAVGTVLDAKFRIVRRLGVGGMGAVYEVEHELTKHRRALKLLHPEVQWKAGVVERFLREASAAGRIGDPHIIETFDAGSLASGEPYVVMELLQGETLAAHLKARRRLELPELVDLVAQVCDGVQAAHDAGIVHRDLKPDNLFIVDRGGAPFVKILDFGVSKFNAELTDGASATSVGNIIGTPQYMPPEQVRGVADLDGRADVYALGVLLYRCAAGKAPYEAGSLMHLLLLVNEGNATPLQELRPDLPAAFCELVAHAMAGDRDKRIPSARALGQALRELGPQTGADRSSEPAREKASAPLRTAAGLSAPPGPLSRAEVRPGRPEATQTEAVASTRFPAPATRRIPPGARAYAVGACALLVGGLAAAAWAPRRGASASADVGREPVTSISSRPSAVAVVSAPVIDHPPAAEAPDAGAAPPASSAVPARGPVAPAPPSTPAPAGRPGRVPLATENPFR